MAVMKGLMGKITSPGLITVIESGVIQCEASSRSRS